MKFPDTIAHDLDQPMLNPVRDFTETYGSYDADHEMLAEVVKGIEGPLRDLMRRIDTMVS